MASGGHPKPEGCLGCPLYDDGLGFVPDELVEGARVVALLQNPGHEEERCGRPAVGATGEKLDSTLLPAARLTRGKDVSVANAFRCRWRDPATGKKTNKLPPAKLLKEALAQCRQYDGWDSSALIVACGAVAATAMGAPGTVSTWRGFLTPSAATAVGAAAKDLSPTTAATSAPAATAAPTPARTRAGTAAPAAGTSDE